MNARNREGSDLTGLTLAAIAVAMVALALVPGRGRAMSPRQRFGTLVTRYCRLWTAAAQADNPAVAAPLYAKDAGLVFFGLGESEYRGWRAYGRGIKAALFDNAMSMRFTPGRDLQVHEKGAVAWTTSSLHVHITWDSGRRQDFNAQQTAVWEERDGRWVIVHEHISSPPLPLPATGS